MPILFHAELLAASEPDSCSLAHDTLYRFSRDRRGQWIRSRREGLSNAAGRLVDASGRRDQNIPAGSVRHHLGPAQQTADARDPLESLPIEAQDFRAGTGPKRAVGCDEEPVDFG